MLLRCALLQNISLTSLVPTDQQNVSIVYPGEVATFQCTTRGSFIQAWSSAEYIQDRLEFVVVQSAGTVVTSGFASAELIDAYIVSDGNEQPIITSRLRITVQRSILNSSVTCHHAGGDLTATVSFELSNSPVLTARKICPEEHWVFTCEIRDSSILAWESNLYIGAHGKRLEFLSAEQIGTMRLSNHWEGVFAVLTGNYHENLIQVLSSQLTIPDNQYHHSLAAVVCVNVGLEARSNSSGLMTNNYTCNTTTTTTNIVNDTSPPTTIQEFSMTTVGSNTTKSDIDNVTIPVTLAVITLIVTVIVAVSMVIIVSITCAVLYARYARRGVTTIKRDDKDTEVTFHKDDENVTISRKSPGTKTVFKNA